jgi:hypothetical protein
MASRARKSIPAALKRLVWNKYIGEEIGKAKCTCCNTTDITQMSFHCGHVLADSQGGTCTVENLRPICQSCNSSMGAVHMDQFKMMLGEVKETAGLETPVDKIELFKAEWLKYQNFLCYIFNQFNHAFFRCKTVLQRVRTTDLQYKFQSIQQAFNNLKHPGDAALLSLDAFNDNYARFTIEKKNLVKFTEKATSRLLLDYNFNW